MQPRLVRLLVRALMMMTTPGVLYLPLLEMLLGRGTVGARRPDLESVG